MKDALTNIDVYVLSRELEFKKIQKAVKIENGYKIKVHPGKDLLYTGNFLIPTQYTIEGTKPDIFCQLFKKYFSNTSVHSVEQINFDRILAIRTPAGSIIFELFHRGNIIFTDPEGKIIFAREYRDWRHRSIRRGVMYNPPPAPMIKPELCFEEFSKLLGDDPIRSLVKSGLPPIYAQEIALEQGIEEMYEKFKQIMSALNSPEPYVIRSGEEIVDVVPLRISIYEIYDLEPKKTFSEALDVLTPLLLTKKENKKSIREHRLKTLEALKEELKILELMIEKAYEHSSDLISAMENPGNPPENIGPFKLKRADRKEIVYDFTP